MYSFDGKFRRTPNQDLSGAIKKLPRDALINRAKEERKQREEQRQRNQASITIQAFWRSYKERVQLHEKLRKDFDELFKKASRTPLTTDEMKALFRDILIFFDSKRDFERLISFGQVILKAKETVINQFKSDKQAYLHRVKKLIDFNIQGLSAELKTESNQSLAIPFRLIEVFTLPNNYKGILDDNEINSVLSSIWDFLIHHNYFAKLRTILDKRVPEPYEICSRPPTPLADSIFELMVRPMNQDLVDNKPLNTLIVENFFEQLMKGPFSPQIKYFVLPSLLGNIPKNLTAGTILSTIFTPSLQLRIEPSIWNLYLFVKLVAPQIAALHDESKRSYLIALSNLSAAFPEYEEKSEASDDEDELMDISEPNEEIHRSSIQLMNEILEQINEAKHVSVLLSLIDYHAADDVLVSLCKLCYALLSADKLAINKFKLIYTLAFSSKFLRLLWQTVTEISTPSSIGPPTLLIQLLSAGIAPPHHEWDRILPSLTLYCALMAYLLPTVDDVEFYETSAEEKQSKFSSMPFNLYELQNMTRVLRDVCIGLIDLAYHDSKTLVREDYRLAMRSVQDHQDQFEDSGIKRWKKLFKSSVHLLRQLYNRDSSRPFCPPGHWISSQVNMPIEKPTNFRVGHRQRQRYQPFRGLRYLTREELEGEGPPLSTTEIRNVTILQEIPFVVTFADRVRIFQALLNKDKMETRGDRHQFLLAGSSIDVMIRRNYIYEDAFDKLSLENEPSLKKAMRIQLTNAVGLDEAGIDGGGIMREFLNELLKTAFDPNRGFFKCTSDSLVYPNPGAHLLVEHYTNHYYFIGRMLGKAIYENMLVELPFAHFFLAKLLSPQTFSDVDIHHLGTLDVDFYKNLVFLKNYNGDFSGLNLDFTILNSDLGENEIVELKPNGKNIPVTAQNRIEYIHLMADYRLNKQIRPHCTAFKQGLANVIDLDWIRLFSPSELHTLISGTDTALDIEDLRKHTVYAGGYSEDHPCIKAFWKVVGEFDDSERRKLLKFVTSCSRPPLLGFKDLHPSFTIHFAGREDRLPTASTCMNLLKLPEYIEKETLKQKLLYAISSNAGFELS